MTSATDTIRAMLDERGVEWRAADYNPRNVTEFKVGGIQFRYIESSEYDDFCWIDTNTSLTPKQAIEATLGRGTCRNISPRADWKDNEEFTCSECGFDGTYELGVPNYCPNCGKRVRA